MKHTETLYHSALSRCAEMLDNMKDGDPITEVPEFLAAKLKECQLAGAARQGGVTLAKQFGYPEILPESDLASQSQAAQPSIDATEVLARQVEQWTKERDRLQDLIDTAMPEAAHLAGQSQATRAVPEDWRKAMRDLVRVLRGVECGEDTQWKLIANVCANAEVLLADPTAQEVTQQAAPEFYMGVAVGMEHKGATITIMEKHGAGTIVRYTGMHPVGETIARLNICHAAPASLRDPAVTQQAAKAETAEQAKPECGKCNDSGIVGFPPDQYESCPDCTDPVSQGGTSEQQARFAIDGAIQYGRENRNPPPSTDHWLYEYWNIGRQLAKLGETGWDNVTPLAPTTSTVSAPEGCEHCLHTYCLLGEKCRHCGHEADSQGYKGGKRTTSGKGEPTHTAAQAATDKD